MNKQKLKQIFAFLLAIMTLASGLIIPAEAKPGVNTTYHGNTTQNPSPKSPVQDPPRGNDSNQPSPNPDPDPNPDPNPGWERYQKFNPDKEMTKEQVDDYLKRMELKETPGIENHGEESKITETNENKGSFYGVPMNETGRLYGNPKDQMSKTTFIMGLIKTNKIIPGRTVFNRIPYSRIDHLGQSKKILTEPVETSPYQRYMGEMGIDTGQTDVVISHEVFDTYNVIRNADVAELYLVDAYQRGLFNLNDLNSEYAPADGKELKDYLKVFYSKEYEARDVVPRWAYDAPVPLGWKKIVVSDKVIEEDNAAAKQYPQQYFKKWREVVSEVLDWQPKTDFVTGTKFWGNLYLYSDDPEVKTLEGSYKEEGHKKLDNWFDQSDLYVTRRKSSLEDPVNGVKFFNNESMTVLDAYKMAYKVLLTSEGEKKLSDAEVDYINSAYQMNMVNFLPEEVKAVKYLIAKGVITGEDINLYQSANMPLTNEVAIDLLYRIVNKEDRYQITPTLSNEQKAMVDKGFSQVNVNLEERTTPIPQVYLGPPKMDGAKDPNKANIEKAKGYKDIKNNMDKLEYNYIFVRIPKGQSKDDKINFQLRVNDEFRTIISGYRFTEDGSDESPPILDAQGYEWRLYTVHKDTSSDLVLTGISDKTGRAYEIYGINGEGFYWLADDDSGQKFQKWSIKEFLTKATARSAMTADPVRKTTDEKLYKQVSNLLELRTTGTSVNKGNRVAKVINKDNEITKFASNREDGTIKITKEQFEKSGLNLNQLLDKAQAYNNVNVADRNPNDGSELIVEDGRLIWQKPIYGANELRDIKMGPMTKDELQGLRFGNDPLVGASGKGFQIDKNNALIKSQGYADRLSIEESTVDGQVKYTINLKPKTADYKNEMAKFTRHISSSESGNKKKMPGFAKMVDNKGNPLVLISKEQLGEFGIEAMSDKLLYNPTTGQRAFINTDDNMTLIGNNITHYSDGYMMVNAFGAKGDHNKEESEAYGKIYYNLDIVMELLNNTKAVEKIAGKDIYIAKEKGDFETVKIYNRETQVTPGDDLSVAQTYIYRTGDSRVYINLSAMTGMTSNFIYYKNRDTSKQTVDALIVYKPRDEYVTYDKETDNTLTTQMIYGGDDDETLKIKDVGDDMREKTKDDKQRAEAEKIKAKILSKLFIGATDSPGDIMGLDYTYDIYLLSKGETKDNGKDIVGNFIASLFGKENESIYNSFIKIADNEADGNKIKTTDDNKYKDMRLGVVKATTSEGVKPNIIPLEEGKEKLEDYTDNFLIQESTGNLYFYAGDKNQANSPRQSTVYKRIFGQNLYYNGKDIGFRLKHYYQNTPMDFIPLERYAEGGYSYGSTFLSSGYTMQNFELPEKSGSAPSDMKKWKYSYKLPMGHDESGRVVYNNNQTIVARGTDGEGEVGMYTKLELPYQEIKVQQGEDKKNYFITDDGIDYKDVFTMHKVNKTDESQVKNASNYSERPHLVANPPHSGEFTLSTTDKNIADKNMMTEYLFRRTLFLFDKELNKVRSESTVNDADRTFDIIDTFKNSKLSPDKGTPEYLRDLMAGTWDSLIQNYTTYNINFKTDKLEDLGIKLDKPDDNFILITTGTNNNLRKYANLKEDFKTGEVFAFRMNKDRLFSNELFANNGKNVSKYAKRIDSLKDLYKFADGDKIFFKPSLAIPQGTNVVDKDGRIRTLRNPLPREEVLYAADIINSMLFRITLNNPKYKDKTMLYQIPEGAVVDFGNGSYFIKATPKQTDDKLLKWVNMITSPKTTDAEIPLYQADDFTIMTSFLSQLGNRITIPYNTNHSKVPLKSIVGKGLYVAPHIDLLNEVMHTKFEGETGQSKAEKHLSSKSGNIIVRRTASEQDKSAKIKDYDVTLARYDFNGKFSIQEGAYDERNTGSLSLQLYMPPTIEVEKIVDPDNEAHYKVVMYHDIRGFQVDKDNSYIMYLRNRDTDADEILDGIHQVRTASLNGLKYINMAKVRFGDATVNGAKDFLMAAIPLFLILAVILIHVAYVILYFPEVREFATDIARRFGLNIANKLDSGWLSPATLPNYLDIALTSLMLVMFSILFANGMIFDVFGKLFRFIMGIFTK